MTTKSRSAEVRDAFAGASAGLGTTLALYPLDLVKTRLQVQDGANGGVKYKGTADAFRTILRCEGLGGLFAGLAPSMVGNIVAWGLYYSIYNSLKRAHSESNDGKVSWQMNLVHGVQTGTIVSLMTNPIWVLKTRMQLQERAVSSAAGAAGAAATAATGAACDIKPMRYRGMLDAAVQITRTEGPGAFFSGLGPQMLLVSHSAIQFMAYEQFKGYFRRPLKANSDGKLSKWSKMELDSFLAGGLSKLCAATCTYPLQVLKSRLQQVQDPGRALQYTSARQALSVTVQREGVRGLYRGFGAHLLRTMPQSAIQFYIFEVVSTSLRRLDRTLKGSPSPEP